MNTPSGFQTVIEHFKSNGWNFQIDSARPLLHAGFKGHNASFRAVVMVEESDDIVQAISFVPIVVPQEKMSAAGELCARLSFQMKMGNFQLDCGDGGIRFHTSSAYPKGELKDEVIRHVVGVNLVMIDQNFPAFIKVLYGNSTPAEATNEVRTRMLLGHTPHREVQVSPRVTLN